MAQYNARVRNYQDAADYLGVKDDRPIGHNTRIVRRDDGTIQVKYHGSPVVTYFPAELVAGGPVVVLNSCGWKTITTKDRINAFIPDGFRVWQERGVWSLHKYTEGREQAGPWGFADGITIDAAGNVYNAAPAEAADEVRRLTVRIRKYAKAYAAALVSGRVPAPSAGDCWYCAMETEDGAGLGEKTGNVDHLLAHLEESYFVPSLIVRAHEYKNFCIMARGSIAALWNPGATRALSDWEKSILTRDAVASLTAYLKHWLNIAA